MCSVVRLVPVERQRKNIRQISNHERDVIAKHVEVTATHVVAEVRRIRYRPGRRGTFVAVC
jgi:hypothetical protein